MKILGVREIKPTAVVSETPHQVRPLGKHESTMTLCVRGSSHYFIRWSFQRLHEVIVIDLIFKRKSLKEYEGISSLPPEAITLIRECGFVVPRKLAEV